MRGSEKRDDRRQPVYNIRPGAQAAHLAMRFLSRSTSFKRIQLYERVTTRFVIEIFVGNLKEVFLEVLLE